MMVAATVVISHAAGTMGLDDQRAPIITADQ
jgi:hypothetical protein